MKNKSIHSIGHRARMREKFMSLDTEKSSDNDLLEMILFLCYTRKDVKPIVHKILGIFKNLRSFLDADTQKIIETLTKQDKYPSLSANSAKNIAFISKLFHETILLTLKQKLRDENQTIIANWSELISYLRHRFGTEVKENFFILYLNKANKLLDTCNFGTGTIDEVTIYSREVIKKALETGATSIVMVHNHFSGEVKPSNPDILLTKQMIKACEAVNIEVFDHVIVSADSYFSFRENFLLEE